VKGAPFFIIFFLLFAVAILLIPTPMFPGDNLLAMANMAATEGGFILGGLINALLYSLIAWAVFVLAMKKVGSSSTAKPSGSKNKDKKKE